MDIKKLAPWNWLKSEEPDREGKRELAPRRGAENDPVAHLHREIDRLFDSFLPPNWLGFNLPAKLGELGSETSLMKPTVDISESARNYTIKVEVPGVEKEDIHIDVQDDMLVIRGEKKHEKEQKDEHFHRIERSYGSFQRVLNLPPDADSDDVKARFRNGVLSLVVAKSGEKPATGRAIEIS